MLQLRLQDPSVFYTCDEVIKQAKLKKQEPAPETVQDVKVFQFVSQKTLASASAKTAESFKSVQCDLELLEAEASRL